MIRLKLNRNKNFLEQKEVLLFLWNEVILAKISLNINEGVKVC